MPDIPALESPSMPDRRALDRAARSILREELALLEHRLTDRLDWLEERLTWICQRLDACSGDRNPPDPYPSGPHDRPLEAILEP